MGTDNRDMVLRFQIPGFGNYMRRYFCGPYGTDFERVVDHRFESD